MSVLLPWIGVTSCERAIAFAEKYPQNIVGSFWIMAGYGFDIQNIPSWWIDIVLEDNQAQAILDAFDKEWENPDDRDHLRLGYCIIVTVDSRNPSQVSYIVQHLRMVSFEGLELLKIFAQYNIPAITEVSYPEYFLERRYQQDSFKYNQFKKDGKLDLSTWSAQVWEDYGSYLIAQDGERMFVDYYRKVNEFKDAVEAVVAVENKTQPIVLTEGETDPIYIKTALELLGEDETLNSVDIEWVGSSIGKGKSINTGDGGLNRTRDVLISNPKFLNRKVLLLYDCDTKRSDEDCNEYLKIRRIPKIEGRKVQKGIENLFPDHLFKPEFYVWKETTGDYGEVKKFQEFQRMKFCKWLCEERRNPEDFKDFKVIVDFIKTCLGEISF